MTQRRLLLDQMFDAEVARVLDEREYDVVRVADMGMARADDSEVLARAIDDARILVTLDEHFGDWAVLPLSEHPGVIRVKADPATTSRVLEVLLPFLDQHRHEDFTNVLAIVRPTRIRWIRTDEG